MYSKVPDFLTEKSKIYKFLIFVAFFALLFIAIYKPYGSIKWLENYSSYTYLLYTSILIVVGFILLYVSRMLLFYVQKKRKLQLRQYIIWLIVEIFLISISAALVGSGISKNSLHNFSTIMSRSFLYTLGILFLPYLMSALYFAINEKEKMLQKVIKEKNKGAVALHPIEMIHFYDRRQVLVLSLKFDNLLYVESDLNNVTVCYLNNSLVCKYTLHNTLSVLEKAYNETDLIRCHRSFLVNSRIIKLLKKENEKMYIELEIEQTPKIPVSKTFADQLITKMNALRS